ncbi:MAG: hypothetical protein DRI40_03015 [Chloroflexi bacterium]|nr:MAG: hypothetical protein DRI40_03015 [Chloroflexota bacterium]
MYRRQQALRRTPALQPERYIDNRRVLWLRTQDPQGVSAMEWEFVVALALAIPIILLPVAIIWYLNLGSVCQAIRRVSKKRAARWNQTESAGNRQIGVRPTERPGHQARH